RGENVPGVDAVKSLGAEPIRGEEGEARLVRLVQDFFSLQKLGISMNTFGSLATTLAGVVILWYGGHRVIAGALTIGELMFFYTLLGYLLGPPGGLGFGELKMPDRLGARDRRLQG